MVGPQGLTGVLDWELAHAGDPVEDLGWVCVPAWRFARRDRPAAGLGTRAQLLEAYERHSGVAVDPAALSWWELAGTLRWGVICVMQAFSHLSGARRSVEHAVIGRRACEVEWDLLELLGVPLDEATAGRSAPSSAQPVAALHDRPTAIELLHASRGGAGGRRPAPAGRACRVPAAGRAARARDRRSRARALGRAHRDAGCRPGLRRLRRRARAGPRDPRGRTGRERPARAGRRARHRPRQARRSPTRAI